MDAGGLDETNTFNLVNELLARDLDSDTNDDETLVYDKAGHLIDDGRHYTYEYDAFGRLRRVVNRDTDDLVAEYRYNGLGFRTGRHSDVTDDGTTGDPDGVVDGDDPWFWFCYDESWRIVAVFRAEDEDPKEVYVHHNAGLDGHGASSYIDAVVLRDRDANTAWHEEADGTLEERVYYCQNWRADVVALFSDTGHMLQQVRYDPYGVPFGISKADVNADGVLDSADSSLFVTLYNSGSGTHPFADWNLDGSLSSLDLIAFGNSYSADAALGYGTLSYDFARAGGANRKGYAGYELAPELSSAKPCLYHVRYRVYDASLGRWTRRDPMQYLSSTSLYDGVLNRPVALVDPMGLQPDDPFRHLPPVPEYRGPLIIYRSPACRSLLSDFILNPEIVLLLNELGNCQRRKPGSRGRVAYLEFVCKYCPLFKRDPTEPKPARIPTNGYIGNGTIELCYDTITPRGLPKSRYLTAMNPIGRLRHEIRHAIQGCESGDPRSWSCNQRLIFEMEAYIDEGLSTGDGDEDTFCHSVCQSVTGDDPGCFDMREL